MSAQVKVNDSVFRELTAKIGKLSKAHVKIGVLESHGGGDTVGDGETTMAELLAIHEYGAPGAGIPARAPLRRTFGEGSGPKAVEEQLAKIAKAIINEKVSVETALEILGQWGVSRVRQMIRAGLDPALRPATIKRKGSSTPLIDTGHLMASLSYEVKK